MSRDFEFDFLVGGDVADNGARNRNDFAVDRSLDATLFADLDRSRRFDCAVDQPIDNDFS